MRYLMTLLSLTVSLAASAADPTAVSVPAGGNVTIAAGETVKVTCGKTGNPVCRIVYSSEHYEHFVTIDGVRTSEGFTPRDSAIKFAKDLAASGECTFP